MLPQGSKGGGSSSPTQAPDTLSSVSYAQMLDLLSEGPIYGPPSGDIAQSTYLNDVPLKNADGSFNFAVNSYDYRPGTVDQTYIPGFDSAQQINNVGVALTHAVPWSLSVTDLTQNAVVITLGVSALSSTDPNSGNVSGYTVAYQIQLQVDSGAWQTVVNTSFNGKCTSAYQRSHRISLSGAASAYNLRVIRVTQDNTSVYIQDKTSVVSYALVVDAKLRYPFSALASVSVDAVQFSSVPTRSYDLKGLLVSVPSNYNPVTRIYTGAWDGTFVSAWTDNPAWIFYDLVLNTRYGAGQWVNASQVDRYSLYQIAQYCDQMVSDGMGGQEPRFTCNCYIKTRADAYKVLQDLASIFRGMSYWAAGSVVVTADMPQQAAYIYTAANVIGGKFKYVGSSLKTRYTAAVVTWNNPQNGYKQEPEYVEDANGIARYGVNRAQVTAFGCTSRGQAQRVGQWLITTSRYETDTVTFSVGLDGTLPHPGQIVQIADPNRAAVRRGGRILSAANTASVTVDKIDPSIKVGDSFTAMMPNGTPFKTTISGISGNTVTVNPALASLPVANGVWISESATVNAQTFRILSIAEKDGIEFEITATQYNASKFGAVDNGAAIDVLPITSSTFTTQAPPTGVTVGQWTVVDQGIAKTNLTVSWQPAANGVSYRAQIQKDSGAWVDIGTTGQTSVDLINIYAGSYIARVSCTNGAGISSVYAYSVLTVLGGKTTPPPVLSSLTATLNQVFAVTVNWAFPVGAGDTKYTEVWYSHTNDFSTATQLGTYSYPTKETKVLGLVAGYDLYFWARLVDTSGNTGAWFPAKPPSGTFTGVHGMSTMDASSMLQYLTGQITATQLAQSLAAPIQTIPAIQTDVTKIKTVTFVPMSGDGGSYAGDGNTFAGLNSEQSYRADADLALSRRLDNVYAQFSAGQATLAAGVQTEATARATADAAMAQQLTTVQAQAGANTAAINTEATTRAAADSAQASQISKLQAVTFVPMSGDTGNYAGAVTAYAGVYSEQSARADADLVLSQRIDSVTASYQIGQSALSAQINTEAQARATADSAQASQITTIQAQASSNAAAIQNEATARAAGDSANASQIATVQTQVNNNTSAIQSEATARANGDSANAAQINTVQTQVNNNTAAIQTNANSYVALNGTVSAMYTVKTQVTSNGKTYVAGIGLSSDNTNGSQVLITADRFAVLETAGGNTFSPFVIQNGQAFINQAFIGNAWITNAMIANASITGAQIQNGTITNALIADAQINDAKIVDQTVTNAKIANGAIDSAKIQSAAIQNAHIANAQIDTLKLGANAATSAASFGFVAGGSSTYWSSGGVLAVFLTASGTNTTWNTTVSVGGNTVRVSNVNSTNFILIQPGAGGVGVSVVSSQAVNGISVLIMEFKR
ncbi:phage tail protein [Burkholderia cenocepacia]